MTTDALQEDSAQRQLRQASAALDRALRAGRAARAEEWLTACPALAADDDLALELIYGEFVTRESLGDVPPPQEYYDRFPARADRLRRLFEVDALLSTDVPRAEPATHPGVADTRPTTGPAGPVARHIGPFQLLEKIGGGGMGVVYRARQESPRRTAAVKLLRSGSDASAIERARFRREAEAAARLQHPNLVTVYSVGEHEGQPYLAMEFVEGGDLRARLAGRPMPAAEAARLVATLGRAVDAAHQAGVVHRDLKPANVLVNGDTIKIADFGLAALVDTEAGLTRSGQALGTLAYMAPEQATGGGAAATPAVDVYSLGAILYECLTGRPPFVADSEAALVRQIAEADPVSPRSLVPGIPADLETIALKCLAKSPARRYASAAALVDDIERYLNHTPILARPIGRTERAMKWARRHPAAATTIAASVLGLGVVAVLTSAYTAQLQKALHDVQEERNRVVAQKSATQDALDAEVRRRAQARTALDTLTNQLMQSSSGTQKKAGDQLRQLEQALKTYQELALDPAVDVPSRLAAGDAHVQASRIQSTLERDADADASLTFAVNLFAALAADDPKNVQITWRRAGALHDRARVRYRLSRTAESLADGEASLVLQRQLPDAAKHERRRTIALTTKLTGDCLDVLNRRPEAAAALSRAEEELTKLVDEAPTDRNSRNALGGLIHNRGMQQERAGDLRAAEASYRRATELRVVDGKWPDTGPERLDQARCYGRMATLAEKRGAKADAVRDYLLACRVYEDLADEQPNVAGHAKGLADALTALARLQVPNADLDPRFRRVLQLLQQSAANPDAPEVVVLLAGVTCNHGHWLNSNSRPADAVTVFQSARSALTNVLQAHPEQANATAFLTNTLIGLGNALTRLDRHTEAVDAYALAVESADTARRQMFRLEYAKALARAGRVPEALAIIADVPGDPPQLIVQRASVYAIAAKTDAEHRSDHQRDALGWLGRARLAGQLRQSAHQTYLKTHPDWSAVRDLPGFKKIIPVEE